MASGRYSRSALVAVILAMQAAVAAMASSPPYASSYIVFDLADNTVADRACTLREAMLAANDTPANADCGPGSASGLDHVFIVQPGTIVLDTALPAITQGVIITGHSGGTTIDGNRRVRPFVINPSIDVRLEDLTITNARAADGRSGGTFRSPEDGENGGAIHNRGTLTLLDVRITNSVAGRGGVGEFQSGSGGDGGAIYNAGTLSGYRVTFDGNAGGDGGPTYTGCCAMTGSGGAIYNAEGATMTLLAATFTGNLTGVLGPSGDGAAVYTDGPTRIVASTFLGDRLGRTAAIVTRKGVVELASTILADAPGCRKIGTSTGGFIDRRHNLSVPGAGCGFSPGGSITDWSEPVLQAELRNNGGRVPTFALLSPSPARDVVPAPFYGCGGYTDARGVPRPQDVGCDIGAYEIGPSFRRATHTLTITGAGAGQGTVSSDGVDCAIDAGIGSGRCSAEYEDETVVNPTATAAADSIFVGWEGDRECEDGSVLMDGDKTCTAIFDLSARSVRGSAYGVGEAPPQDSRGSAQLTFNAEFDFDGALDLASATLTIDVLLGEEEEGGAGELVAGLPIVLQGRPGASSSAAIFKTTPRVTPIVRVDVRMEQQSSYTLAVTIERATIPRFPQLCSLASRSARTNLMTMLTLDDGIHAPVTVTAREPWRCLRSDPDPAFPLRPHFLKTP